MERHVDGGVGKMVKEGHDSTVKSKVKSYGFDGGKLFVDAWHADGKPMLSNRIQSWVRVGKVLGLTVFGVSLLLSDWGTATSTDDHVLSSVQRSIWGWWTTFTELDEADVAKAKSVARRKVPQPSLYASAEARENFARAVGYNGGDGGGSGSSSGSRQESGQ